VRALLRASSLVGLVVILVAAGSTFAAAAVGRIQLQDSELVGAGAPVTEPAGAVVAQLAEPIPTPPGTTQRQSVGDDEAQANTQSGGATELIAAANGDQAISADGRWVAFVSTASNLIPGTTQPPGRVYLRDRLNGTTTALPFVGRGGWPTTVTAAEPAISADGGVVAFTAIVVGTVGGIAGPTGAQPYVVAWDRTTNVTELVSMDGAGSAVPGFQPAVSGDGRFVTYTQWAAPAVTPPPDTTGPFLSNLTITGAGVCYGNQFCIYPNPPCGPPHAGTVSVTATDPAGVGQIQLWYRYGFSGGYASAPLSRTGDTWSGTIGVGGVGLNQIDYYWEAFDSLGNRSVLSWTGDRILRVEGCIL
jgi:hypothetical protein